MALYIDSDMAKIPECCGACSFQFGGHCTVQPSEIDDAWVPNERKPEWCPLKEQSEADEVAPTIGEGVEGEEVIYCGSCGTSLYHLYQWKKINKAREFVQYCRHCGQKVKWDEWNGKSSEGA